MQKQLVKMHYGRCPILWICLNSIVIGSHATATTEDSIQLVLVVLVQQAFLGHLLLMIKTLLR
jgi:hypothetical protein